MGTLSAIKELKVSALKSAPPMEAITLSDGFCDRKTSRSDRVSEKKIG
jgi:hypothetical protein